MDLHVHTKWSDGAHDLDALIEAVRARKYGYVAITDHSKGLGMAHGLTEDRVREQMGVIDAANRKLKGFRILKGIEVDIRGVSGSWGTCTLGTRWSPAPAVDEYSFNQESSKTSTSGLAARQ